jgi:hypothetical protein
MRSLSGVDSFQTRESDTDLEDDYLAQLSPLDPWPGVKRAASHRFPIRN